MIESYVSSTITQTTINTQNPTLTQENFGVLDPHLNWIEAIT